MNERGDWMQTFTGVAFYPAAPLVSEVCIYDIAHALSMICRFAGHSRRFYSVAEHSILVSSEAPTRLKLRALLHDASEAYVCDLPRPLKRLLPEYKQIEQRIEHVIRKRFGLEESPADDAEIKALDDRILDDERRALFLDPPIPWGQRIPLGVSIHCISPAFAEAQFLDLFRAYGGNP